MTLIEMATVAVLSVLLFGLAIYGMFESEAHAVEYEDFLSGSRDDDL